MQSISHKKRWLAVAIVALTGLATGTVLAHEGRDVEGYNFVVGWVEEPAYEGLKNGVEIRVTKAASGSHGGHGEASEVVGVEGLGETLRVEVAHVATDASKVLSLYPTRGVPGRYTAVLIPTAPEVYQFSVRGTVEGTQIDESFLSKGGGGGFDDIRSAADLQFPETLPQIRELESAVRGALETAQRPRTLHWRRPRRMRTRSAPCSSWRWPWARRAPPGRRRSRGGGPPIAEAVTFC